MNCQNEKSYTDASENMDSTNIFQFLVIFALNLTVLPQNRKFWRLSAWYQLVVNCDVQNLILMHPKIWILQIKLDYFTPKCQILDLLRLAS